MLHEFIVLNRLELIRRCRAKVAARSSPLPTTEEIDHGVPMFLDQLGDELRMEHGPNREIEKTAAKHGHDLLRRGFTVAQVVRGYGDVCQSVTELAIELDAPITVEEFRMLNRCLDDAIAGAVTEYGREQDAAGGGEVPEESERLGILAHQLRRSIHKASVAYEVIKAGRVGIAGSTGSLLDQSLSGAHELIDRLLAEVRRPQSSRSRQGSGRM